MGKKEPPVFPEWLRETILVSGAGGSVLAAGGATLDGVTLGNLTPPALLAICVLLVVLGRLVPRTTLNDVIKDRDEWREAHRISEEARVTQTQTVTDLLEYARTADAILRAIHTPAGSQSYDRDRASD